jgi:peptide/nickel transport system substrate-binding protein
MVDRAHGLWSGLRRIGPTLGESTNMGIKRVPRAVATTLALVLVLGACKGGSDSSGSGDGKPVQGGTLVRAITPDPKNLDPILATDVAPQIIVLSLFDRLLRYDAGEKSFIGDLATDSTFSADFTSWSFPIRKGVEFTNGREITPADVKYSFERISDPKNASPAAGALADIVGTDEFKAGKATGISGIALNGDTVTFTFRVPVPAFNQAVAQPTTSIVPREEVEKLGAEFGRKPVGSGPFKLKSWAPDDRVIVEANTGYWAGRPYLDEVVFRIVGDPSTRNADFRSGGVDMMTLNEDVYAEYKADPTLKGQLLEVPELFTRAIFFNNQVAPYNDVRVRRAINLAIDKKSIIEKSLANKAFPAVGPLQGSSAGWDPDLKGYDFNPEEAKRLLAEAGLGNGFEMEVIASATGAPAVETLAGDLQRVGITLKIMQVESPPPIARSGNFNAVYYSTGGDIDPISFMYARLHTKNIGAGGNVARYSNPEVDRLLDQGSAAKDPAERARLAREAQKLVVADAPWFFFNYNKAVMAHKPKVHGIQPVPTDVDFQDLTKIWIDQS